MTPARRHVDAAAPVARQRTVADAQRQLQFRAADFDAQKHKYPHDRHFLPLAA